jgi:hypothetical protein
MQYQKIEINLKQFDRVFSADERVFLTDFGLKFVKIHGGYDNDDLIACMQVTEPSTFFLYALKYGIVYNVLQ